ncbi:MAG: hypothetical protein EHM14_02150 [Methanothrix sp.]|nr:MAG: hypothetical protein EHM14_02150 [Methanothrix sp.]
MLNETTRTRSGDMAPELQAKVDKLLEEFMEIVDAMVDDRHLQKGIARSQLPSSMVAIIDRERLTILAQFRASDRFASYFTNPKLALTPQQAANSAQWEFGFVDAFIIQFPKSLLDHDTAERRAALEKVASDHIDSEFLRLEGLLSLMRTRPIFGTASSAQNARSALLLLPQGEGREKNRDAILSATLSCGLSAEETTDIRNGKAAVREMWSAINETALIIADLTGADPAVMYGLGIAHTVGKQTILIYPQGSRYLTDIPKVGRIEYEESDVDRTGLEERLSDMVRSMLQPVAED